MNILQHYKDRE